MCGRYALAGDWSDFTREFALEEVPGWEPRFNIAPSYGPGFEAPILRAEGIEFARFWYIPSWWKQPVAKLPTSFNVRSETAFQKSFFRGARACLVPTSGWREFPGPPKKKRAFQFSLDEPEASGVGSDFFAFCGLYDEWTDPGSGEVIPSFAILTSEPSDQVRPYHHRMPVIARPSEYAAWLNGTDLSPVLERCVDYSRGVRLHSYECSTYGNSTRHEGPECIAPVAQQQSLF